MDSNWRKSSYSGDNGGECVEVASAGAVLVRDTADRSGPVLTFTADAWLAFTATIRYSTTARYRAKRSTLGLRGCLVTWAGHFAKPAGHLPSVT